MAFLTPTESMFQTNYETTQQFPSSSCAPLDFNGGASEFMIRRSVSYSGMDRAEEMQPDEESDDGLQLGEKKRRLNVEQVRALEKSFELGNKLEPDRKMGLARALGLNPRQVSIWFQNRRARVKTKQLERDYDILKRQYDALKANNDSLKSQNNRLEAEIMALESKESRGQINLNRDNEGSWNDGSELSCHVKLNTTSITHTMYHHHPSNKHTAPFSSGIVPSSDSGSIAQLLNNSSMPTNDGFYNMFGGIEENSEMWPWHQQ